MSEQTEGRTSGSTSPVLHEVDASGEDEPTNTGESQAEGTDAGDTSRSRYSESQQWRLDKTQLKRQFTSMRRTLIVAMRDRMVRDEQAREMLDDMVEIDRQLNVLLCDLQGAYVIDGDIRGVSKVTDEMEELERDMDSISRKFEEFSEQSGELESRPWQLSVDQDASRLRPSVDPWSRERIDTATAEGELHAPFEGQPPIQLQRTGAPGSSWLERSLTEQPVDQSGSQAPANSVLTPSVGGVAFTSAASLVSSEANIGTAAGSSVTSTQPVNASMNTSTISSSLSTSKHGTGGSTGSTWSSFSRAAGTQVPSAATRHTGLSIATAAGASRSTVPTFNWTASQRSHGNWAQRPPVQSVLHPRPPPSLPPTSAATASGTASAFPGPEPWKQLKKIGIPVFNGDKRKFETWRAAFTACVDAAPATPEYKLLQMREYLAGEALHAIDHLGYSAAAYDVAKDLLVRKYGGERRRVALHIEAIDQFGKVGFNRAQDFEKFDELLQVAVINLKDVGLHSELLAGTLYQKVLKKLDERSVAQYHRWRGEHQLSESVEILLRWVRMEAEYLTMSAEAVSGLATTRVQAPPTTVKRHRTFHTNAATATKPTSKCPSCSGSHPLWRCLSFKTLSARERWNVAKQAAVCYRCLGSGHRGKDCSFNRPCGIDGCTQTHHRLLHEPAAPKQSARGAAKPEAQKPADGTDQATERTHVTVVTEEERALTSTAEASNQVIALRTVPVVLRQGNAQVTVNALLDDASTKSYLSKRVAAELHLDGEPLQLTVTMLNGQANNIQSKKVVCQLASTDARTESRLTAILVDEPVGDMEAASWSGGRDYAHLADINFPVALERRGVELLIGADHPGLHRSIEERAGASDEPVARLTPLGWTCVGPVAAQSGPAASCHFIDGRTEPQLSSLLERFWAIEEASSSARRTLKDGHSATENQIRESLRYIDGRYEVGLPWKDGRDQLDATASYSMAMKRLQNTAARLQRDPDVARLYSDAIQQYEAKGYVNRVPVGDKETAWYLPHFPIVKMNRETTKVRIVYDAAAVAAGRSLNSVLEAGPKLQQDLVDVLLRFRRHEIAVACDISEMYMQIRVQEPDRRYLRFLWSPTPGGEVQTYEFQRLVFGLNSSPFIAQFVARHHASLQAAAYPLAAEAIADSTYMDDTLDSVATEQEAVQLYKQLTAVWGSAGMKVHKWLSNSPALLAQIPASLQATSVDITLEGLPTTKTLGIQWSAASDSFAIHSTKPEKRQITKRSLLQNVAKVFDPLGFMAPVVVRGKLLIQRLWTAGIDWDEEVDASTEEQARRWLEELSNVGHISIPRCLHTTKAAQLHVFVDASQEAYAAVAYVQYLVNGDEVQRRIVASKSKVAPLQAVSIPRLELMAAVLGVRLAQTITAAVQLPLTETHFWSDSNNVLCWIRQPSRTFKPFVANRVAEIQLATRPEKWHYVPTRENPADLPSRGMSVEALSTAALWWEGPDLLAQRPVVPPETKTARGVAATEDDVEKRRAVTLITTALQIQPSTGPEFRLQPERFSSWQRLVRVTAWVYRFISSCRRVGDREDGELTIAEIQDAESSIIKRAQADVYAEEISKIRKRQDIRKDSVLRPMTPMLDEDGMLRSLSRLQNATDLPDTAVTPLILPRHHHVTALIIQAVHDGGSHAKGTNHVISELAARFLIPHVREAVKEVEKKCNHCKRSKARPARQLMAPLPASRVTATARAFDRVGVDYAGPFIVKQGRGQRQAKRWLCLFTCLATRAVHLEIATGLDVDAFLNAFYRMISRRGVPTEVLSDNGTNFVGSKREMDELWRQLDTAKIQAATGALHVQWHFNPPAAPHFGGPFEAMIKAAKRAIYAILGACQVTDEELLSAVIGAEGLINSRPLTSISTDPKDDTVLTPNHFIFGQMGGHFAPSLIDETPYNLRKRWRRVQELVSHFWKRWMREWLPLLSKRPKWQEKHTNLKVGDLVMVLSTSNARAQWPLGRVMETYPGQDRLVRVAKVLVKGKELVRPISKLCPLEICE